MPSACTAKRNCVAARSRGAFATASGPPSVCRTKSDDRFAGEIRTIGPPSPSASAVSRPTAWRESVALAEKVMKTRPLRISTAAPSFTRKPWISQARVGEAIRVGFEASVHGLAIRAM